MNFNHTLLFNRKAKELGTVDNLYSFNDYKEIALYLGLINNQNIYISKHNKLNKLSECSYFYLNDLTKYLNNKTYKFIDLKCFNVSFERITILNNINKS